MAARLRSLSETYGLASREMSLVAVVKRAGDVAGHLPDTRVVPVGMPQGMKFGAIFAGASRSMMSLGILANMSPAPPPRFAAGAPGAAHPEAQGLKPKVTRFSYYTDPLPASTQGLSVQREFLTLDGRRADLRRLYCRSLVAPALAHEARELRHVVVR